MKIKIFRWKAIAPLLVFFILLGVLWILFGDLLVEDTSEEVTTKLLGTQVDISGLHIRETESKVEIGRLEIADPFNPTRNLIETGSAVLDLDPAALLEKKLVVDRLRIQDLRLGTTRRTPARAVSGGGFAPTLLRQVRQWSAQFDVPLLKLTPFDTVRSLVLDPTQLGTVREAEAVIAAADSLRTGIAGNLAALNVRPTVDSARALAERLVNANPAQLGIAGTRDAVLSVRRTLQDIDTLRGRIEGLKRSGEEGINRLKNGIAAVDQARQKDYAFARSLLQLPSFAAPDIGAALFGPVSIERFEKAVYWAELAQRHLPPGLAPQSRPAPKRLRMDGTDVAFPRERAYPSFLLRDGAINVAFSAFGGTHTFEAKASGITSQPALYGRPAMVSSSGRIGGSHPMNLLAGAVIDHTRLPTRDSARARLDGVPLPNFSLPGLPFRVEPGAGSSDLAFSLRGNQVAARWALRTENAIWQVDSTGASKLGTLEGLIWRVLSGLRQLDVTAELKGSLRAPQFSVHSNIDQAIADQVKSLLGEEVQAAEKRVRAEVDKLVAQKVEEVGKQVDLVTTEARTLVTGAEQELNTVKAELESRLKSLTGGLGGVLR